jgi:hypothetical protein
VAQENGICTCGHPGLERFRQQAITGVGGTQVAVFGGTPVPRPVFQTNLKAAFKEALHRRGYVAGHQPGLSAKGPRTNNRVLFFHQDICAGSQDPIHPHPTHQVSRVPVHLLGQGGLVHPPQTERRGGATKGSGKLGYRASLVVSHDLGALGKKAV